MKVSAGGLGGMKVLLPGAEKKTDKVDEIDLESILGNTYLKK